MLTGKEIITQVAAGKIIIQPFDITKIKANSYDLTIGNKLLTYNEPYLDPRNKNMKTTEIIIPEKIEGVDIKGKKLMIGKKKLICKME
jgi:deoxycytidine triphosphate deaminase